MSGFRAVISFMERWADTLRGELRLVVRPLTHSGCQVTIVSFTL